MIGNVESEHSGRVELAVDIVAAYVSNNSVPSTDLPGLIGVVHGALNQLADTGQGSNAPVEKITPAQIRKSITKDHLVSFEDGKPYKTLRRHLTLRGLSPEAYRAKWGLPRDYPMTAESYSAQRSELARALGLGQQRRKYNGAPETTSREAPKDAPPAAPTKARGRKKASAE
ncbi:Predicted transcriptional regulator [Methylobacterium phyllostachyos]|uniref:Predicted transcriptional regulator n=1 Tax=Methylobacterium phyllostachyos TaxID=582672 RepID=A0A1G9VJE1_9HYPH|nr:MucR family transcriptional regulator [Methylobacterium phyllostachyos]SDM72279.1 Predicted transcriptional regulator [Methylobacterium phyllostachyos]